ncbi:MAG: hypothetical protein R3224_00750, partial [Balneolaceae bacterium]|nr:hypothetical protein [Balneolaceae bacterium]
RYRIDSRVITRIDPIKYMQEVKDKTKTCRKHVPQAAGDAVPGQNKIALGPAVWKPVSTFQQ